MRPSSIWAVPLAGAISMGLPFAGAASPDDYTKNAVSAITTLNSQFYNVVTGIWDEAWWNSANVFTMLADFTTMRLEKANELNLGGYMHNTFVQAQKTSVSTLKTLASNGMVASKDCIGDNPLCAVTRGLKGVGKRGFDDFINEFYDDEGWWCLAMIRAFDATGNKEYLDAAVTIFEDMQTGQGGPCDGGIFWNKDRAYVNAISNELYLSAAASLANRIPENNHYLQIAKSQWQWFKNSGLINKQSLINDGLNADCKNNGLQTWSYNQGVILGGLAELFKATGNKDLLKEASKIAKAAMKKFSNVDGILIETDECELRPGHCGRDGQQFKGIFVRNLRYLHDVAPDDEFKNFIIKNADVIWTNNRNDQNLLGVSWSGPFVTATGASQSSSLDVIVAAIAVA